MRLLFVVGFTSLLCSTAHAELLSKVDWANSFKAPLTEQGPAREQDFKKFAAGGKKSNDKDLAAWCQTKLAQIVGKPVTFEITGCDKTAKHAQYQQEQLHGRIMQNVIGDLQAIAQIDAGKQTLQTNFKGVRFACTQEDACGADIPKAQRAKSQCETYFYDAGYYTIRFPVGDAGEALPYPSGPSEADAFRLDESNGPSFNTVYALALVKKYLPQYQKAVDDAFGAPLPIEIDWSAFNRTSKDLPGYPLQGGWAFNYVQDGLEEFLLNLPAAFKEYYRQADQYSKADIPLVKKNLKRVKIVMHAPKDDSPAQVDFKIGVLTVHGRWTPSLGVSDTDLVPVIGESSGHKP